MSEDFNEAPVFCLFVCWKLNALHSLFKLAKTFSLSLTSSLFWDFFCVGQDKEESDRLGFDANYHSLVRTSDLSSLSPTHSWLNCLAYSSPIETHQLSSRCSFGCNSHVSLPWVNWGSVWVGHFSANSIMRDDPVMFPMCFRKENWDPRGSEYSISHDGQSALSHLLQ